MTARAFRLGNSHDPLWLNQREILPLKTMLVMADMWRPPLDEFVTGELNDFVRAQLLTAIEQLQTGRRYFTYNAFDVLVDAELDKAAVEDEFEVDRRSTVALAEFRTLLRAVKGS